MKRTAKLPCILAGLIFLGITMGVPVYAEDIKVGVLLPLTGKLAGFGKIEQKSFLLAVAEINASGGVDGRKIALIIEDTRGRPDIGRSAIEKLISQDKVCVVGGGFSSSVTWAAVCVAQQRKVPFLVNTASADRITRKGWSYIFRLNPPVSEYYDALASFLTKIAHVKTAAILYENTLFGQSKSREFAKQCKELGLKVVTKECFEAGTVDFKPLLINIRPKKPDLFYMISSACGTDASLLMRQVKELDLNAKLYVGGAAGFTRREFRENAGDASEYIFSPTPWTPSVQYPGAKDFYYKFFARYNKSTDYHGAQAYAAMYVIADALKRAKSLTPQDVRDALAETDMMTVFGPVKFISYRRKTQQNKLFTFLGQWRNGRFEAVWPRKFTTVRYVYPVPGWYER
jgi:branched-chain amino acid transport system substrate-binding protein